MRENYISWAYIKKSKEHQQITDATQEFGKRKANQTQIQQTGRNNKKQGRKE